MGQSGNNQYTRLLPFESVSGLIMGIVVVHTVVCTTRPNAENASYIAFLVGMLHAPSCMCEHVSHR